METFTELGPLCRTVREGRVNAPGVKEIALACGYQGGDAIRKFERGNRKGLAHDRYTRYVGALHLLPEQQGIMDLLYKGSMPGNLAANEDRLGHYSFRTITDRGCDRLNSLRKLVEQLQRTRDPAFIMDELWYVHAFNSPIVKLFNMSEDHLRDPLNWHVVATKYNPGSVVRHAHRESLPQGGFAYGRQYYPYAVRLFFGSICPYFFTEQLTNLRRLLGRLSPDELGPLWDDIVTMRYFPRVENPSRKIYCNDRRISVMLLSQEPVEVEVTKGYHLQYRLALWRPDDREAREVLGEIEAEAADGPIAFAVEYGIPDYNDTDWCQRLLPHASAAVETPTVNTFRERITETDVTAASGPVVVAH